MARRNDRSLGFIPLLLMGAIWVLIKWQLPTIGNLTSRAGHFNPWAAPPRYGCPIPAASQ